jgi:hypothetical protein
MAAIIKHLFYKRMTSISDHLIRRRTQKTAPPPSAVRYRIVLHFIRPPLLGEGANTTPGPTSSAPPKRLIQPTTRYEGAVPNFRTSTLSRLERSGSRIEGCGPCDESWQTRPKSGTDPSPSLLLTFTVHDVIILLAIDHDVMTLPADLFMPSA